MPHRVYLDNASTTDVNPEVLQNYEDLLARYFANSDSLYEEGTTVRRMMEKARKAAAGLLGVLPEEILFTSGSCESNSTAVKGVFLARPGFKHIITSQIEHPSILNACAQMERLFGCRVTYLPVSSQGIVSPADLQAALSDDTALVSIMAVNNETGAINPIPAISEIVQKHSHAYLHVDMTQAIGKIPLDLHAIDLVSISAHKLEGLKGSGILVKKKNVPLEPLISGGEQEYGLRGGTSNAAVNIMFAKTLRLALANAKTHQPQLQRMHDHLLAGLQAIPGVEINSPADGICTTVNFSYEKIPSEVMQNALNQAGFQISARSTCASRSSDPSYVLKAMGFSDRRAASCIRVSFSWHNTEAEIDQFLSSLKEIIAHYGQSI